jgi:ketosteroid isomerase-like protein
MQTQKEENMKTLIILIAAAGLAGLAFGQQPNRPPTPGPEHKKLDIWVGDWTYETVVQASPLGPAGKYVGKNTTRPILAGLFVEFRGEDKGPTGTTQWTETDGYDPLSQRYIWKGFASDGSFNDVSYTIEGTKVTHSGTVCTGGKTYRIRGTIVFAADFLSNVEQREISTDGKTWMPLWECRAAKITPAPTDNASADQELINLERQWNDASIKDDAAFLDRILADDLTDTSADGTVSTKIQDLADLKSGAFKCTSAVAENFKVRVCGDMAVVTGRNTIKAQFKGKDISGPYQFTDTWMKRDGRWQCVATHGSKVEQK